MGRALATAALAAGHPTVVWNRTPGRADPLVARGAVLAPTVGDAVRAAPVTIACMIDYAAVRASTSDLTDRPRGTLINLSSGHAAEARDALYQRHRTLLAAFGGTSLHLGDDVGMAAAYETALLDLFAMSVGGLAHAFALAVAEGIAPAAFARFAKGIGGLLPDLTDRFAAQLAAGQFPADVSSVASAASALSHVRAAATVHGIDAGPLEAVHRIIERAVAAGHGGDSYARLAQQLAGAGVDDVAPRAG